MTDFRQFYDTQQASKIGQAAARAGTLSDAAHASMRGSTHHNRLAVSRATGKEGIVYGRETAPIALESTDTLVLSARWRNPCFKTGEPILGLRYGVYDQAIVIGYAQTPANIDFDGYQAAYRQLRVRPHEFMVAQFLARIAPVLDKFPNTEVFVAEHYLSKPVYPMLRDRFLDRSYSLHPDRARVQQLLGEDNVWLKPDAILTRAYCRETPHNFDKHPGRVSLDLFI